MTGSDGPGGWSAPTAAEPRLAAGTELAGYRIESPVGRGGMGIVYRAHDLALDRKVALKVLAPELAGDVRFRERFLRESRLAASLDHPAIIPIYDAGEVAGQLYIAMRLVEGTDFKQLLAEEDKLEPERTLQLLEQVAEALDSAHERGLVHRDVKPSNVLVDHQGHCYLADFGLSRRMAEQGTRSVGARSLGTVDYVAPEQIRGEELDGRADLYSLGCLLYECLAGRPPFTGASNTAVVFAHLEEDPPSLPGLENVISKALAKRPDDRYQSGGELVAAAREALGLGAPGRSLRPLAVAAATAALAVAVLLGYVLSQGSDGVRAEPGADSLVRIDPQTNKVGASIPVGREASGVAASGRFVWVTSYADGNVSRVDSKTRALLRIPVGGSPTGVAAGGNSVLVANGPEHSLASFDSTSDAVNYVTQLAGAVSGSVPVAAGKRGVWFADATEGIAGQVDLAIKGGAPVVEIPIPADETSFLSAYEAFDSLAVGEGAVWVAGDAFGRTVWKVDPGSRRVGAAIKLPFVPGSIAAGEGGVWVTSVLDDAVVKIDPTTNRIVARIPVARGVGAIAAGDGAVWVASSIDRVVTRIDPRTDRIVALVPMAGAPTQIAIGAGGVWVATTKPEPGVPVGAIGIGVLADCRGAYGSLADSFFAGAELALLSHGGRRVGPNIADGVEGARIAGKPVTLSLGCANGTTASALSEARRLVEQVGVQIVVGPSYGSEEVALAEYARRHPGVAFVNGLAGAQALNPPRNFFSFTPDGAEWMAGLGAYAYRTLGWRRAVTVADLADIGFNWSQTAGFIAEFCSLGGTIVKRIWVPSGTQDYSGVVAEMPVHGADGVVAATGPETVVALATRYPGLRGNLSRKLLVGAIAINPPIGQLGRRISGVLLAGSFLQLPGVAGRTYLADLRRSFPGLKFAGTGFDIYYHDGVAAVAQALAVVQGDLSHGERRFMAALARVRLRSPSGSFRLDSNRQAVGPNYLVRMDGSLYRRVGGVEHTFAGYFTPDDPPPSETTPVCRHGSPPPWAR